jgi:hypothetical protein
MRTKTIIKPRNVTATSARTKRDLSTITFRLEEDMRAPLRRTTRYGFGLEWFINYMIRAYLSNPERFTQPVSPYTIASQPYLKLSRAASAIR